jgi:pimeloyl-ACP methyl ester carboxylesterase
MADALADAGFRVFVLDLPAHGSRAGAATDAYQLAGAISAAGAAIGATVDLVVAHSLGVLASVYAMTSPEIRPALGASSMVMVAPGISPDLAMTQFAEGVGMPPNIEARVRAAMEQRFGGAVWTQAPDMIRDIDVPGHILVVHDHDDDRVPFAQGEELARNIEAGFLATSGFGHNGILKAPEVIDAVVAFATIAEHAT